MTDNSQLCDLAPDNIEEKYESILMKGLDEDSHYVVLKRVGKDKHYAVRLFTVLQPDGDTFVGGKIRLAYNDFYEDKEGMKEKLDGFSKDEMETRAYALVEAAKCQIPWLQLNPIRAKVQVGEPVDAETNLADVAKDFVANFEKLTDETVDDKMLVFNCLREIMEHQRDAVAA